MVAACAVALAGCGGRSEASNDECKLGLITYNQQDTFFVLETQGAKDQAAKLGCSLEIVNPDNDATRQATAVDTLVTKRVDALIVDPIDIKGIRPALDAARNEGVKVIAMDADVGAEHCDTFVGMEDAAAAKQFAEYLDDKGMAEGKRYGVVGARNSFFQNVREDSFRKVYDEAGAEYTQTVSGENQNEKAATAAENLLTAQDDLDYVYTTGTPATLGAVSAIGDSPTPKVVGWDLSADIIKAIDKGVMLAAIQQQPIEYGTESVKEAKRLVDSKEPRKRVILPTVIVTKKNVDEYRDLYEK